MILRTEQPEDYQTVYDVVKRAFSSAQSSDGNEQDLVNALRKSSAFLPQLSLVAEVDGKVVGHILFTKVRIGNDVEALALAPLSVLPEYQKQGIGTALIHQGHAVAKELGYHYSIVLGSEDYYPRFGYLPAEAFGIRPPFAVPSKNFMACKISENAPAVLGVVKYAKEFGIE